MTVRTSIVLRSSIALAALASSAATQAGVLHILGAGSQSTSFASDVSADGSVVVGFDNQSYWYWTLDTWVVQLLGQTIPPGNGVGGMANITDDGTRMTVSRLADIGGLLKAESHFYDITLMEYTSLGSWGFNCDVERNGAWGMSPDGNTVVGLGWQNGCAAKGYVWTASSGVMTELPTAYFFKPTRANAVSANGSVVVGWNDDYNGFRQGAVWINGVETLLTAPPATGTTTPRKLREAGAVSRNGVWAGGLGKTSIDGGAPWRWSVATGYESLGQTGSGAADGVTAINADGTKILCFTGFGAALGEGVIWIQGRGYVPLEEYAAEHGVDVPADVHLALPLAFSADEQTIVGSARGPWGFGPFVLDLHGGTPPCPGDLNGDHLVDGLDMTVVLSGWGSCP